VRGFIRGYAKVLRVDATPILAAISNEATVPNVLPPERSALSASFSETKLLSPNQRSLPFKAMVGGLVLIVIGLLAFVGQRMGWIAAGHSTLAAKVEEKLSPVEPVESKSAAVVEAPEAPPEVIETQQPSMNESVAPAVLAKPPTVVPAPPVVTPVVNPPVVTAAAVPIDSKDALAVRVRQDSWVEIKRADDSIVVSRLMKAGSSEAFEITGPVSMVIGNAAGVDVSLRGKPVDVVAGTASNVARLNLK
jgi:cytoskeleton protein RodZ